MSDPPKGHDMMTNLRQKNTLSFVHTVLYEYTRANSILHPSLSIYSPPMHAPLTININCSDFKIYSRFLLYIFCQCCPFYSICRQSMYEEKIQKWKTSLVETGESMSLFMGIQTMFNTADQLNGGARVTSGSLPSYPSRWDSIQAARP